MNLYHQKKLHSLKFSKIKITKVSLDQSDF